MSSVSVHRIVAATLTSTALAQVNPARQGLSIQNTSTSVLYVKWGAAASATDHTIRMSPNCYYEVPFGYTGSIFGVWASVNGSAQITEL